jgi:transcriptional antiterminator NusG
MAFEPGQTVRVVGGPFKDLIGTVAQVDVQRQKLRVRVSFFGRPMSLKLDFAQVIKM